MTDLSNDETPISIDPAPIGVDPLPVVIDIPDDQQVSVPQGKVLLEKYQKKLSKAIDSGKMVEYVKTHPRKVTQQIQINCKKCGDPIRLSAPNEHGQPVLNTLSNYIEITIACDDGSQHVTNCCRRCSISLTQDDLDDFLIIDAHQMVIELAQVGEKTPEKFLKMLINRNAAAEE